jgi:hypothetical protein
MTSSCLTPQYKLPNGKHTAGLNSLSCIPVPNTHTRTHTPAIAQRACTIRRDIREGFRVQENDKANALFVVSISKMLCKFNAFAPRTETAIPPEF